MSGSSEKRFERAYTLITQIAKETDADAVVDMLLITALNYCMHELKMSTKEACDLVDVHLGSLFEHLAKIDKETKAR